MVLKKLHVGPPYGAQPIDSKNGVEASAILYSIAETAKANGLKPFEYFKFLLEQILNYQVMFRQITWMILYHGPIIYRTSAEKLNKDNSAASNWRH